MEIVFSLLESTLTCNYFGKIVARHFPKSAKVITDPVLQRKGDQKMRTSLL